MTTMSREMSLTTAISLLESQEQNLHYVLSFADLPHRTRKKLRDPIRQSAQLQQEIQTYEELMRGVVRAKN